MFDNTPTFDHPHPAPSDDEPDPGFPSPHRDTTTLLAAAGLSFRAIREVLASRAGADG